MKKFGNWIYWTSARVVGLWARLWFRLEFIGRENIPRTGRCIVASNHASFLDPPLLAIGIMAVRPVCYVARATLSTNPLVRWFFDKLMTIPLDQTKGDLKALRYILQVIEEGTAAIGLFPEGARTEDGRLQPPKGGIGFLVCKSKATVVPAYIDGSFAAMPRGSLLIRPRKIRVFYGAAISPEELAALGSGKARYPLTGEFIMKRIAELEPSAATS